MANQQKLVENGTEVEFNPLAGYQAGRIQGISRWRSTSGKLHTYQFFTDKWRFEIPVIITTAADAVQINTWAKGNTELEHYYDLINEAAQHKTVHIVNDGDPLQMMEYTWEHRYEGVILLEEV